MKCRTRVAWRCMETFDCVTLDTKCGRSSDWHMICALPRAERRACANLERLNASKVLGDQIKKPRAHASDYFRKLHVVECHCPPR